MSVGAERHTVHRAGVAGQWGADRLAGVGVPQPHRLVVAGGGEAVPVGAERHPVHRPVWPVRGAPIGWPVSVSHSRTVRVGARRGEPVPVGAERHADHRAGVAGEGCADRLAGVGVPQPHRLVVAGRGEPVPVGAERHPEHRAGVAGERCADRLAGVGVPQPHRPSSLAEARRCPSGLNATPITGPVWPVRVADRLDRCRRPTAAPSGRSWPWPGGARRG